MRTKYNRTQFPEPGRLAALKASTRFIGFVGGMLGIVLTVGLLHLRFDYPLKPLWASPPGTPVWWGHAGLVEWWAKPIADRPSAGRLRDNCIDSGDPGALWGLALQGAELKWRSEEPHILGRSSKGRCADVRRAAEGRDRRRDR